MLFRSFHTGGLRRRFPTGEMSTDGLEVNGGGGGNIAGWTSAAAPVESQDSMSAAALELEKDEEAGVVEGGQRFEVCSEATSGWTRRVRLGKAPDERDMNPDRKTALELSVRAYAEKCQGHVVNPKIGTEFDSLDEAYEFYNLYSWETCFGIRLAKSRLNVQRTRCMQEIVCACAGSPLKENSRSSRCGCNAMIRLLRSKDAGWYISEHKAGHNHPLSITCGQKMH